MEGLDDYCNQTVTMDSPVTVSSSAAPAASAAPSAAAEGEGRTPGVRAEKTVTFDRFPAVLGLHLNRFMLVLNMVLICNSVGLRLVFT